MANRLAELARKKPSNRLSDYMSEADAVAEMAVNSIPMVLGGLPFAGFSQPWAQEKPIPDPGPNPTRWEEAKYVGKMAGNVMNQIAPFAITAYHGSPHKFDEFKMDKIGTGEGAQAYGHGLYFAEDPKTAGYYSLAGVPKGQGEATVYLKNGQKLQGNSLSDEMLNDVAHGKVQGAKLVYEPITPNLYKVDIPDSAIDKMLDWDKPLSEQPQLKGISPEVDKMMANIASGMKPGDAARSSGLNPAYGHMNSGMMLYNALSDKYGQSKASEMLKNAGIPGIKYLDAGSRSQGQGTRNFVVFDDKLVKILERSHDSEKWFNFSRLPGDEARTLIREKAEQMADILRKDGFQVTVDHSGSKAGPSSYVSVFDPQTNRYIKDPARFSTHSKGAFNSQFVWDMLNEKDFDKYIGLARSLRDK